MAQSSSSTTHKLSSPPIHDHGAQPAFNAAQDQADPPPIVRALTPDESASLLPQELQRAILSMLPRSAISSARLVCPTWRSLIDDMRADIPLREDLIKLNGTCLEIFTKRFNLHLKNLVKCHPAMLHNALRDIAELLKYVDDEQRQECFLKLMDCLPHFSIPAQRWLLCNLAVRVDYYQEDIAPGGSEKHGFDFAQAILDAASKQPVVGQALIVAALIDGMDIQAVSRSPLAKTFAEMAGRWRDGPIDPEAWAVLLVHGLADFLVSSDAQKNMDSVPTQFGFYRMPLPTAHDKDQSSPDNSMPGSAGVDASTLCASILQSDLAWEEKRCLLMFRDARRFAMLERPDEAARLFALLEDLVNDASTLVELIEVRNEAGSTLLNDALSKARAPRKIRWKHATGPWLRGYAECIAASKKLPDDAKVRILRAGMRAPVAERELRAKQPPLREAVRFGPRQEAPFHGVSAVDSLFRDSEFYSLEAYMRIILASPLSDEVKAQVLRLDYPNRTGRPDMHEAHLTYRETVLASSLREDLKDWLLDGVMSDWKPGCDVM